MVGNTSKNPGIFFLSSPKTNLNIGFITARTSSHYDDGEVYIERKVICYEVKLCNGDAIGSKERLFEEKKRSEVQIWHDFI